MSLGRPGSDVNVLYGFSSNPFFTGQDPWTRGRAYAAESKRLLNVHDISITTIQACILLGTLAFAEAEIAVEALYYSLATRLAQVLDLPHRKSLNCIEHEVDLRGERDASISFISC